MIMKKYITSLIVSLVILIISANNIINKNNDVSKFLSIVASLIFILIIMKLIKNIMQYLSEK